MILVEYGLLITMFPLIMTTPLFTFQIRIYKNT